MENTLQRRSLFPGVSLSIVLHTSLKTSANNEPIWGCRREVYDSNETHIALALLPLNDICYILLYIY